MSAALRSRVQLTHRWATEVPGRRANPTLAVAVDGTRARAYLLAGEARMYLADPENTLRRFRNGLLTAARALDWNRGPAARLTVVSKTRYAPGGGWVLARASYDKDGPGVTLTVSGDNDTGDIRIHTLDVALTTHSWLGNAASRVDSVLTELAEYGPCATGEKNTRWHTAVHEAGHVIVGRKLGGRGLGAVLDSDTRGHTTDCNNFTGSVFDEAVYVLAGSAAGRLITGDPALDGSGDLDKARELLAGTDRTMRDAERRAAALARRHRQQIVDLAWRLYLYGRV